MAKLEKKEKQSAKTKKQKRVKELFFDIRGKLQGIKYGYIANDLLKELEDLVT